MERNDLERLVKKFSALLPDLLAAGHVRRWVVVGDEGVLDVFDDFGDACTTARARLKDAPFIVQRVQPRGHFEKLTRLGWT